MARCVFTFLLFSLYCIGDIHSFIASEISEDIVTPEFTKNILSSETCTLESNDCINGGTCTTVGKNNFCVCLRGTSGHKCDIVDDCEIGKLNCGEKSGAECVYNKESMAAECVCKYNLKYNREAKLCQETCTLESDDCINGGMCTWVGKNNFCVCLTGTSGHKCDIVDDCETGKLKCGEKSGAECVYNKESKVAECVCKNNLKYNTEAKLCQETCTPGSDDCKNGATCTVEGKNNFCQCLKGTSGHKCDIVDDCQTENSYCGDNSGAECMYNKESMVAECVCKNNLLYNKKAKLCRDRDPKEETTLPATTDYRDPKDEVTLPTTTDSGDCDCGEYSHGCHYRSRQEKECDCYFGFSQFDGICKECSCGGKYRCSFDMIGDKLCYCSRGYGQRNGTCEKCFCGNRGKSCLFQENGRKHCICDEGYGQRNVTCTATCNGYSDCMYRGTCIYEGNSRFCNCDKGFKGDKCEISEACDSIKQTCDAIGAKCKYVAWFKKAFCECPHPTQYDWRVNYCVDICYNVSCNHGACEVVDSHKECRCEEGYEGTRCERKIPINQSDKNSLLLYILIGIAGLIFITSVVTCIVVIKRSSSKKVYR